MERIVTFIENDKVVSVHEASSHVNEFILFILPNLYYLRYSLASMKQYHIISIFWRTSVGEMTRKAIKLW
jgi:hypothetical protein